MVLEAPSIIKAIETALKKIAPPPTPSPKGRGLKKNTLVIWLTPSGKQFDNNEAEKISKKYSDVVIICGRYEGIDARVKKMIKHITPLTLRGEPEKKKSKIDFVESTVGPFVLTGGELPAMIVLDTVSRRIPGVLGKIESVEENRVSSSEVYTRPEILEYRSKKYRVPKVLLSGDHKKIEEWKSRK
jgi:tRNA (guanine37-N1)-methyltransferase